MRKVIDDLKGTGNSASAMRLGEEMIAKTVCRHAVKANDPLRYPEVEKLIRDLLDCDLPYCCPHGRPTMIQISLAELEEKNSAANCDGTAQVRPGIVTDHFDLNLAERACHFGRRQV